VLTFYDWLRRHPVMVDSVLALVVASLGLSVVGIGAPYGLPRAVWLALIVAMCLPIAIRRKHPVGTFIAVIAVGGLEVLLLPRPVGSDLAVLVVLYTLAAYRPRQVALPGLVVCLIGSAIAIARWAPGHAISDLWTFGEVLAVFWGPAAVAWLLGDMTRWRRSYYRELEERAARLERERDAQAQIAAAAERARIARELHDVVAHNVSVMVVQADGASYALDSSPDKARDALAAISATGRQALAEMRSLLGVLRSASDASAGAAAELEPQPGIEQLAGLLEQARLTGLPVSFTVEGVPRHLPQGTALTAYRVVQESLTNARKHGGAGVTATVTLRFCEDEMAIIVSDDGTAGKKADDLGHGLIGMRERVELFGGTVTAGPRPGGGFQVFATLPVRPVRSPSGTAGRVSERSGDPERSGGYGGLAPGRAGSAA
jgi:signal transduction histidine kinase